MIPPDQLRDAVVHAARAQFALELERELIPAIIAATESTAAPINPAEGVVQADDAAARTAAEVRRILRTHAIKSACIAGEASQRIRDNVAN